MKLTFEINPLTLPDARDLAKAILDDVANSRRLDRLAIADLCAHVMEPRRKTSEPAKPQFPNDDLNDES